MTLIKGNLKVLFNDARGTRQRSWDNALQAARQWVRFPMVSLEFFIDTLVVGSTQPLTEMSTKNITGGVKAASAWGWQLYHFHVPTALKSGSFSLLEPSRPIEG